MLKLFDRSFKITRNKINDLSEKCTEWMRRWQISANTNYKSESSRNSRNEKYTIRNKKLNWF